MFLNKDKTVIFFGDSQSCNVDYKTPAFHEFCQDFAFKHCLDRLLFNKQVHGDQGFLIDSSDLVHDFKNIILEGDFLVTDQKNVGIGVLTADCLPVLFYDRQNHAISAIHAGWRSSVLGVCRAAFQLMNKKYGTNPGNLEIYFGPCAKVCCYQVQPDFLMNLKQFSFKDKVIQTIGTGLFFDNVLLNRLLIEEFGVDPQKINCDYNECTICNRNFYSYRRDAQTGYRQISFIALKD